MSRIQPTLGRDRVGETGSRKVKAIGEVERQPCGDGMVQSLYNKRYPLSEVQISPNWFLVVEYVGDCRQCATAEVPRHLVRTIVPLSLFGDMLRDQRTGHHHILEQAGYGDRWPQAPRHRALRNGTPKLAAAGRRETRPRAGHRMAEQGESEVQSLVQGPDTRVASISMHWTGRTLTRSANSRGTIMGTSYGTANAT